MASYAHGHAARHVAHRKAIKTHEITAKLANLSEDALNKVDDAVLNVQTQAKEYSQQVEKYMHKYPLKTVGIAVLAGAVFATVLRHIK